MTFFPPSRLAVASLTVCQPYPSHSLVVHDDTGGQRDPQHNDDSWVHLLLVGSRALLVSSSWQQSGRVARGSRGGRSHAAESRCAYGRTRVAIGCIVLLVDGEILNWQGCVLLCHCACGGGGVVGGCGDVCDVVGDLVVVVSAVVVVVVVFAFAVLSIYGIRVVTGEKTLVKKCACLLLLIIVASESIEIIITIISPTGRCRSVDPSWLSASPSPALRSHALAALRLNALVPVRPRQSIQPASSSSSSARRPSACAPNCPVPAVPFASPACRSDPTAASQPASQLQSHGLTRLASPQDSMVAST